MPRKKSQSNIKRAGRWSRKEKEFILQNSDKMTIEQLSEALGKNKSAIRKFLNGNMLLKRPEAKMTALVAEYEITKTPMWKELQAQFNPTELDMFIYHWKRIVAQFKDDIFPTEELQIVDTIKAELLMGRSLEAKRRNEIEISRLMDDIQIEMNKENPDNMIISNLERRKNFLEAAQQALGKEYIEFAKRKDTLMKDMKATRDQRVKTLENSRTNIVEWIKDMLQDHERRNKVGRDMEKMRHATEVEVIRLTDYLEYDDKTLDRPLLIPERIEQEEN